MSFILNARTISFLYKSFEMFENQTEKAALIRSQKLQHFSQSINSLPFLLFLCRFEPIFYLLDKIHYRLTEIRNTINEQAYRIGDFPAVRVHQKPPVFLCHERKKIELFDVNSRQKIPSRYLFEGKRPNVSKFNIGPRTKGIVLALYTLLT